MTNGHGPLDSSRDRAPSGSLQRMAKAGIDIISAVSGARRDADQAAESRRSRKQRADALSRVPLFSDLSRRHLNQVADEARIVSYRRGAPVIREGDLGATLFVIIEGEAKVTRGGKKLAMMAPGDFFGEISLLDGGPRTATVVAETPLSVVRLYRAPFFRLVQSEPDLGVRVLSILARRIRRVDRAVRG
jgi:CRP/FNR family cyclic AMP-dependent transcriptional regulator